MKNNMEIDMKNNILAILFSWQFNYMAQVLSHTIIHMQINKENHIWIATLHNYSYYLQY